MFYRKLLKELENWRKSPERKPLILRGARQIGKTTLVQLFAEQFEQTLTLNLELPQARRFWQGEPSVDELLRNIEVSQGCRIVPGKTLLFLDEIQSEPKAIQSLRYLYETRPELHVIATGSLLEFALQDKGFSFPVGRVSFLYLYPVTFEEFLIALGRNELLEEMKGAFRKALSPALHALASELFSTYLFLGGMPEAVQSYLNEKSFSPLGRIQEGLLTAFEEDVPKYARSAQVPYIHLLIRQAPLFAGQRIKYENFANSGYRSREMRQAFDTLEQAMVIQRVLATTQVAPPLQPHSSVSPKLLYLDVGLVSHRLAVDPQMLRAGELNDLFRGTLAEQIVGQEILAQNLIRREPPNFWLRNSPGSTAEVDYCVQVKGTIVPIEVKSGKSGKLRSLQQFMEIAPHPYAIRVHSGSMQVDACQTRSGKTYQLLSIPFYLAWNLRRIIENFIP